jgi:hypothetical protein
MLSTRIFPTCLIVLSLLAAGECSLQGFTNWRKVVYWLAAAVLNFVVTF